MKDFFADPAFQEELRRTAANARNAIAAVGSISEIGSGDSFLFSESEDLPVRWVAILQHKDNASLWFLVAADEFSQVGTCDVEVPESDPMAPLALRCNVGIWVHQDDDILENYVGRLNAESVADARSRLSEMVHGKVPVTDHGLVAEANDDYRMWIAELSEVAHEIENRLQAELVSLPMQSFDTSWVREPMVASHLADFTASLAADATGVNETAQTPPGLALPSQLPGALVLQREGDEFDLVYFPASKEEQPPRLIRASGVKTQEGHWALRPDGAWVWSQPLLAVDGRVFVAFGGEKFDVPVN